MSEISESLPASIAFLGSGETAQSGGLVFEFLAKQAKSPLRIAVLETPAGFELNSHQVAARVAQFIHRRLSNYTPIVEIVAARKRGTPFSPDDPNIVRPLAESSLIFMGPGSPTYAVRQLQGSWAWETLRAAHRLGAMLVFASAATIAVGSWVLPVYEIYKVGEDVHLRPGLNLPADWGGSLSFIPHWNNTDGGEEVDTSRCFIGQERFEQWRSLLPEDHLVVGLDEHTALILDFHSGQARVLGKGRVTLLRGRDEQVYPARATFPLEQLGALRWPADLATGIRPEVWEWVQSRRQAMDETAQPIPAELLQLLAQREAARQRKDWEVADALRKQIQALGWQVQDTPQGSRLVK